ncbi:MAG TPA: nitroreductase/quinone reductase family protein, partial [Candidatus Limnocylindria bacterium]|nr:nitroreductase/quinone reductase family protein [Candidatus Limnocylindria bacterium]
LAHPEVTVETDRETFRARATVHTGEERQRLYDQHAAERPEFRDYPQKTTRVIPVITLERMS